MLDGFLPNTHGRLFTDNGGTPAVAASPSIAVPANERWRVLGLRAQLTTDANAADRVPALFLLIGANLFAMWIAADSQPASTTHAYHWSTHAGNNGTIAGTNHSISMPDNYFLDDGLTLIISTNNLQAGDQWTFIRIYGERWIEE